MIHNDIKIDNERYSFSIDRNDLEMSFILMNETFNDIENRLKTKYLSLSISIEFFPYQKCTIDYLYKLKNYYLSFTPTHYSK